VLSHTRAQLIDQIGVCLGGRVAEEVVYGEDQITTGAQNDLEKATGLARRMITEFGMSDRLGPITFGKRNEHVFLGRDFGHERDYGEHVASVIDEEIKKLILDQYKRVKDLIVEHRDHMNAIVEVLLEKETLDGPEFDAIFDRVNRSKGIITSDDNKSDANPPAQPIALDDGQVIQTASPESDKGDDRGGGQLSPRFA
jgi:cell division protease FtsH